MREATVSTNPPQPIRSRPTTYDEYFAQIDALVASGAARIEDRRKTRQPTGRQYA